MKGGNAADSAVDCLKFGDGGNYTTYHIDTSDGTAQRSVFCEPRGNPENSQNVWAQKESPPESQDGAFHDMMNLDTCLHEALVGVTSKVSMCNRTREELASADARTAGLLRALDMTIPPTHI